MPLSSGIHDPALVEELRAGDSGDELSVIVRLSDPNALPPGARIVTRFGDIATVRVERDRLQELAESATVRALEASRNLRPSHEDEEGWHDDAIDEGDESEGQEPAGEPPANTRRPHGVEGSGKNILVAVLDWGVDPCHPAFQHEDGSTRIISLWDQRGTEGTGGGNRWGYGHIHSQADIDRALKSDDPYASLNYHPADAGGAAGAHGTHVMDIAAGSGLGGGQPGVAPEADLIFVHLARTTDVLGEGNLGDSASVLEALDHVFSVAGERPCVVNMSVGAHGGPHDGETLVELGLDRAVSLAPGRAVVNSAGNYRTRRAHTMGRVTPDEPKTIPFRVPYNDTHDSELEVFYPSIDEFTVEVVGPDGTVLARVAAGQDFPMTVGGNPAGHVYHRVRYGTSGDHHVDVLLRPDAPGGVWSLRLIGDDVHDGRYHAWIERDRGLQPTFLDPDVVTSSTTGTLCNARLSLTCGCVNAYVEPPTLTTFSSGGPTRDGRVKPEIVAPGFRIRAARSTPRGSTPGARYVSKSGTSMAAPHLAGAVALMYEAAGVPLEIYDTRALLFGSADPSPFFGRAKPGPDLHRVGYGMLDIVAAEQAARDFGRDNAGQKEKDEETLAAWEVAGDEAGTHPAPISDDEVADDEATVEELLNDGGNVTEPTRRSETLRGGFAQVPWISDPADLKQLAFQSLGIDTDGPLIAVSNAVGTLLGEVEPGDLLVRSAPVTGGQYTAVIVSERPESAWALLDRGVPIEPGGGGWFVQVVEVPVGGGPPQTLGRRLTDRSGRVPKYQSVLRPATTADPASDPTEDAGTSIAEWPTLPAGPWMDYSAELTWQDLTKIASPNGARQVYYVVTGVPVDKAKKAGDEAKAIFHLRVRNTNSVYNHQNVTTKHQLLRVDPDRNFRNVSPWISRPEPELEDESSRIIRLELKRETMIQAHSLESTDAWSADGFLSRIEVEYHWREAGESRQRHYNRTGLDFMLVAPVEFLLDQAKRLTKHDIELNDLKYQDEYWIRMGGVKFTPELREPVAFRYEITNSVRRDTGAEQTASAGGSRSSTQSQSTTNSFNAQISGELSQGGSVKASIEVLELGLQRMFKLGGTLGYSRTTTETSSTTVLREFARSLKLSRSYSAMAGFSHSKEGKISPPLPAGPGRVKSQQSGERSVRVYLYPAIAFFEVPFVKYSGINHLGQATLRSEGTVTVPMIKDWIVTTEHR
jgi:subtilisin family serine protease